MNIDRARRRATRRGVIGCAVAMLAAAAAAPLASGASAAQPQPFRVLLVEPMSGPLGFVGLEASRGMAAAQQLVNREGGILGHKVVLTIKDSQGNGTVAVAAVQSALASGTQYNLISCGNFGSDAVPCAPVVSRVDALQIPLAGETVLNNSALYPNLFIDSGGFQPNADGVVAKMKAAGIKKFAILSGDDTTGHNGASALQAAADTYGLTVTATVFTPDAATDATPQLQRAVASNPQAFAMSGFTPAIPATIKARTKLGLVNIPVYADQFVGAFNFGSFSTADDRKNIYFEAVPYYVKGTTQNKSATFQAFLKQYYAYDPNPALLLSAAVNGYNALMLARGAAVAAKSIDGNAMAKALAKMSLASGAPGFVGGKYLYGGKSRFQTWKPSDFVFVHAGIQDKGLIVPDK